MKALRRQPLTTPKSRAPLINNHLLDITNFNPQGNGQSTVYYRLTAYYKFDQTKSESKYEGADRAFFLFRVLKRFTDKKRGNT